MIVFGKKWLYSGKSGSISTKVIVFGQSGCIRLKRFYSWKWDVFGQGG